MGALSSILRVVVSVLAGVRSNLRSRWELTLENMALRQQVLLLKEKLPRPEPKTSDRIFWILLRRIWSRWEDVLAIVRPETVVRWHRMGFRLFWRWKSRSRAGEAVRRAAIRRLVRRMAQENGWGAPRIHGELLKLGFTVSERTVSRYMPKRRPPPGALRNWRAFLANHREVIAAMDFFVVPTATFRVLWCFFFIHHGRRKILHVNTSEFPDAEWVVQQLRNAFGGEEPPRYLVYDRDSRFGAQVTRAVRSFGIEPVRTAYRSPWQNGVAERCVLSVRQEFLNHVIVLNEEHLRRLLREYVAYYNQDRTHLTLSKDAPVPRPKHECPEEAAQIVGVPRVGGLHHRYEWRRAA